MIGMLQIFTWMFCFYLVVKGVEIFLMTSADDPELREVKKTIGAGVLILCTLAAIGFFVFQEEHVRSLDQAPGYDLPAYP
jgi:hypothetical protein